jgi:hypothetical protein
VWTIRQLVKDHAADPKAFLKKYRNCILRIQGKLRQQGNGNQTVFTLTSGDTDLTFQAECYFSSHEVEAVRLSPKGDVRIRGLFTGKIDGKQLRLDNCRLDMPLGVGPELTADYLPHREGRSFHIDVATFGVMVNRKVGDFAQREVHLQGREGVTEIVVTHAGPLTGKSLFAEGVQIAWVKPAKVRIRTSASTGIYFRRLQAGFVEMGTPQPALTGKMEIIWLPMLKLGAHVGDKWKWESPAGVREYVLEKFDESQGQPRAIIREIFTSSADVLHPIETLHVYAKGRGEVERRQWKQLDLQQSRKYLLSEMKWVEMPGSPANAKLGGKPVSQPPLPPSPSPQGKTRELKTKE